MRSLHLPMVIANNSVVMSKYLNRMGINTKALSFFKTRLGYEADINLNLDDLSMKERDKKIAEYADYFFEKEVHNYEIFHFHFMSTLSNSNALGGWDIYPERGQYWDLKRLHDMGKKVVLYCVGSEIRNNSRFVYSQMKFCYPTLSVPHPPLNTRHQYKQIWNIIQHADAVVCGDSEVMNNIPYATLAPIPIDTDYMDGFVRQISPDEPMRVLHAPTSQAIKGTDIVLNILHQIQKKHPGLFEIKHIENCTYEEALAQYPGRGPAVDQINQSYGLFALEAMYLGMPVICSLRPEFYRKDDVKLSSPFFSVMSPKEFGDTVLGLVSGQLRHDETRQREYVRRVHGGQAVAAKLAEIYQALWSDKAVPHSINPKWFMEYERFIKSDLVDQAGYYPRISDVLLAIKDEVRLQQEYHSSKGLTPITEMAAKVYAMALITQNKALKTSLENDSEVDLNSDEFAHHVDRAKTIWETGQLP